MEAVEEAVDGVADDAFGVEGAAERVGLHADADEVVGGEAVEGLLASDTHREILRLRGCGAAAGGLGRSVRGETGGVAVEGAVDGADEGGGVVEAFGAGELHAEGGGLLLEVDVDVVEDLDVVAEEADGLEDDRFVAGVGEELEGVGDGGADPGGSGDALRLEGEEPVGVGEAHGAKGGGDGEGGLFALDRVGVGILGVAVVLDAVGGDGRAGMGGLGLRWGDAGHDGAAGDGVGGEEDGDADGLACRGTGHGAGFGPGGPEALGEGLGEEGLVGPAGDEVDGEGVADGGHEGAAVEAGGGAGVLRREAEDAGVLTPSARIWATTSAM